MAQGLCGQASKEEKPGALGEVHDLPGQIAAAPGPLLLFPSVIHA
jgi:putative methionine-R-sulfoxide reductase with GAF domain